MSKKITVVGVGRSGADIIDGLASRRLLSTSDTLVIADINDRAKGFLGEAITASETRGASPYFIAVNTLNDKELDAIKGTDIYVFCASIPFPKEEGFTTRDKPLIENCKLVRRHAQILGDISPKSKVIMVSNPLDTMSAEFLRHSGMDRSLVIGKGADLDTQRLQSMLSIAIAKKMGDYSSPEIREARGKAFQQLQQSNIMMIGVHSRRHMVAVIPPDQMALDRMLYGEDGWLTEAELHKVIEDAKNVGPSSSQKLEIGSPSKGGAMVTVDLIEKLLSDQPSTALVSVPIQGMYGLGCTEAFAATAAKISNAGIVSIAEVRDVMDSPELMQQLRSGVKTVETQLARVACDGRFYRKNNGMAP